MNKRTIENMAGLHPEFRMRLEKFLVKAQEYCDTQDVQCVVISGLRSFKTQEQLYAIGRTKPGRIVTNARPGSSWHNYGLAVDFGLFSNGRYIDETNARLATRIYKKLGELAETFDIEWAGNWKTFAEDCHFQYTHGRTLNDMKIQLVANNYDVSKLIL